MNVLKNFCKGFVAGLGGIAPGLSGSVLLVILGLYEDTVAAIGTLFRNFKKNILFLLPLLAGFGAGILLFSKIVDFLLENYEFHTRYAFLGLVVGTVPMFFQQTKKNGIRKWHYCVMAAAVTAGLFLFGFQKEMFPVITQPNLFQSILLGVAVAGSSIVPGIDSAVILSTLGLYELYVGSLADFNLQVLLPAGVGLIVGALVISAGMNFFLKKAYTLTFSVIFGLFLTIIPNVLNEHCAIINRQQGVVAAALVFIGFSVSYYLGDIQGNKRRISNIIARFRNK